MCRRKKLGKMINIHLENILVLITSENESVSLPPWVEVLRDVTGEKAYKNVALAGNVPAEESALLKE